MSDYFEVLEDAYRVLGGSRPRFSVEQYDAAILALARSEGARPIDMRDEPRMAALRVGVRRAEEIAQRRFDRFRSMPMSRWLHGILIAEVARLQRPGEDFMDAVKRCCDADVALRWAWETSCGR